MTSHLLLFDLPDRRAGKEGTGRTDGSKLSSARKGRDAENQRSETGEGFLGKDQKSRPPR